MNDEPDSELCKKEDLASILVPSKVDYKMQVKITHAESYCQTASEKEKSEVESDLLGGVEGLIGELNSETEKIIVFCPHLNNCDNHIVEDRKGIDANCFQRKSYHCDVLLERIGREQFINYIKDNRNEMASEEFEENLVFAKNSSGKI